MLGVLLVVALAGCFGGPGSDKSNDDAQSADAAPTLPDDLTMDGAEVIHRNETSVTFRWDGVAPTNVWPGPALYEESAGFDLPPEMLIRVEARLTYQDADADLIVAIVGPEGGGVFTDDGLQFDGNRCADTGGTTGVDDQKVFQRTPERRFCWAAIEPHPPGAAPPAIHVAGEHGSAGDVPFVVETRLTALAPRVLHSVGEMVPFEQVADDGVGLRGHVYLPEGDGPFATVLVYSPYWNTYFRHSEDLATEAPDGRTTLTPSWLAPLMDAGFAVAAINTRGSGESDGCWQHGNDRDIKDVATVIEALAAEPWSNGNIGMWGLSYPATTQILAVASGTPSLKAVVPMSPVQDFWSLATRQGALIQADGAGKLAAWPFAVDSGAVVAVTGKPGDNQPGHFTCQEHAELERAIAELVPSGDKTGYWQERDLREQLDGSTVPMLASVGIRADGHIAQLDGMWDRLAGPKHFFLGHWGHSYPSVELGAWTDQVVAFLDHHLRDGPAPWPANHVEYQDDAYNWYTADQWPPAGESERLWVSDGTLVRSAGAVVASQQMLQSVAAPPLAFDCPETQALYVSPPVAQDVRLAGYFQVNLTLGSTLADGNLAAYVYQVDEVGECGSQAWGDEQAMAAANTWAYPIDGEVRHAVSDLRHRGHLEQGSDFPGTGTDTVHLTSLPFATTLEAGNRLVLAVGGGSYDLLEDPRKPVITVHTGPDVVGEVVLPVVEGELRFQGDGSGSGLLGGLA